MEIAFWLELSAGAVDMEDFNSEVIYAQTLEKLKKIYNYKHKSSVCRKVMEHQCHIWDYMNGQCVQTHMNSF